MNFSFHHKLIKWINFPWHQAPKYAASSESDFFLWISHKLTRLSFHFYLFAASLRNNLVWFLWLHILRAARNQNAREHIRREMHARVCCCWKFHAALERKARSGVMRREKNICLHASDPHPVKNNSTTGCPCFRPTKLLNWLILSSSESVRSHTQPRIPDHTKKREKINKYHTTRLQKWFPN